MWVRIGTVAPDCPPDPNTEGVCPDYEHPDELLADENGDCWVNLEDFAVLADNWLDCDAVPASIYCP